MTLRLITIPFSHFCEKARWALDRAGIAYSEDGHVPLFHYASTFPAGGKRTVPVLVTPEGVLADSTDIVAWTHRDAPDPAEALALEDDFDRQLGPAARRWGYFHLLPHREALANMGDVPRWEMIALRLTWPLATGTLRRGLNITPEAVARSKQKVDDTFARVSALLADGRRFLTGDRFTVADLTFAALATPVVAPPEYPYMRGVREMLPAEARAELDAWRATPAGQFALRMYREERSFVEHR